MTYIIIVAWDQQDSSVAEFKEFDRRFKFSWFRLKLYQMFQDLNWRLI